MCLIGKLNWMWLVTNHLEFARNVCGWLCVPHFYRLLTHRQQNQSQRCIFQGSIQSSRCLAQVSGRLSATQHGNRILLLVPLLHLVYATISNKTACQFRKEAESGDTCFVVLSLLTIISLEKAASFPAIPYTGSCV